MKKSLKHRKIVDKMAEDGETRVLDAKQWRKEAEAIIKDVKDHVGEMYVSQKFSSDNTRIYLNLTTLEGRKYSVEVSSSGFRIVGNDHDLVAREDGETFETPYGLLETVSPAYKNSFANQLKIRLDQLAARTRED